MRVAVITPYYKETEAQLIRCMRSVTAQTAPCDHFMVADGHPQDWIEGRVHTHLRLARSHADFGNTPRGLAAQLAISEGYEAIAFLDADNWYDPPHVELCLAAAARTPDCDYVAARRRFVRPDDSMMPHREETGHVDTNCMFLLAGAFHRVPYWNLMPREYSPLGDRLFHMGLRTSKLVGAQVKEVTVNYLNLWALTSAAAANPNRRARRSTSTRWNSIQGTPPCRHANANWRNGASAWALR
jgi:glycosyltransferase involved in cell wall biosynthesis